MERISKLVRQRLGNVVASTLRVLSDTSRMHIMVVQGDDVFDTLCSLEPHDTNGVRRAMRLCEMDTGGIPVRTRVFGEYAVTLVVLEWPLTPSEKSSASLVGNLVGVVVDANDNERHIDGITLIADEVSISENPDFYSCFVETYNQLQMAGHRPLAILQRCKVSSGVRILPFNTLHFKDKYITRESLHQLLSKKIDPCQI